MSDKYSLKEVHIEVRPGVTVIADVSTVDSLISLLNDLAAKSMAPKADTGKQISANLREGKKSALANDNPAVRIEVNAGLKEGSLISKNILAFKDEIPQLLRPSAFGKRITDATLVLIHAVETGLRSQSIEYEQFKGLYESQGLKTNTPLAMLMTNLRGSGYLDKSAYSDGRKIRLTAKGERRAIEILKELVGTQ